MDFTQAWFWETLPMLGERFHFHRKLWEFCFIYEALNEREMLGRGRRGLGFGVGKETLVAAFAAAGCEVVATDLHSEHPGATAWQKGGQHASTLAQLNERNLCSAVDFADRVSFEPVDMNAIPEKFHQQFDFTWSSCALEHVGTLGHAKQFILAQMDCLKPGGWAVHTTEYNLSSNSRTIEVGGTVLFREQDIEEVADALREEGHQVELDLRVGDGVVESYVDVPPYSSDRHLRLRLNEFVSTSIALVIRHAA